MNALSYLKSIPRGWLPPCTERGVKLASNSDLWRWLNMGAVVIDGSKPKPKDEVELPVKQLIFFPNGKHKTTIIWEDDYG